MYQYPTLLWTHYVSVAMVSAKISMHSFNTICFIECHLKITVILFLAVNRYDFNIVCINRKFISPSGYYKFQIATHMHFQGLYYFGLLQFRTFHILIVDPAFNSRICNHAGVQGLWLGIMCVSMHILLCILHTTMNIVYILHERLLLQAMYCASLRNKKPWCPYHGLIWVSHVALHI